MKTWPVLLACLAIAGCAATPVAEQRSAEHLFHDRLFATPTESISASQVFAVSAEMKRYLEVEIADDLWAKGRQRALYDALYSKGQLKLEYDAAMTRNASQAFAARSGNCLSLLIMTAAFAKELGLTVRYQRVSGDDTWSRSGGFYFANAHVNVTLGRKPTDPRLLFSERNPLTIDFLARDSIFPQHARDLAEQTVVAMYMNNRAAEALAQGQVDDAYWWARAAAGADPKFMSSYNTLGIIYKRRGHLKEAEAILAHVLAAEPGNTHALSNQALVFEDLGRTAEAQALRRTLVEIQPYPPFHFFNQGMAAMRKSDFEAARKFFEREVDRDAYNHEFHFWLAAALQGLGRTRQAREHLLIALENGPTGYERELYSAKLAKIRAQR